MPFAGTAVLVKLSCYLLNVFLKMVIFRFFYNLNLEFFLVFALFSIYT